jgi:hypothetical protein
MITFFPELAATTLTVPDLTTAKFAGPMMILARTGSFSSGALCRGWS